jgi:hypothetical protein
MITCCASAAPEKPQTATVTAQRNFLEFDMTFLSAPRGRSLVIVMKQERRGRGLRSGKYFPGSAELPATQEVPAAAKAKGPVRSGPFRNEI